MEIEQIINLIKIKKRHGIIKRVSQKTGISQPTVKKYLNGDVINPKALVVLKSALEDVENA